MSGEVNFRNYVPIMLLWNVYI